MTGSAFTAMDVLLVVASRREVFFLKKGGGLEEGGSKILSGGTRSDDGKRWHSVGVLLKPEARKFISREGGV
jgi:hypothetical protein